MVSENELKKKVARYKALTEMALKKIDFLVNEDSKDFAVAKDFLDMAERYFSDGKHFEEKGEFLTALAAFSYAHAWLDAGVRAKLFDAKGDNRLFTLP